MPAKASTFRRTKPPSLDAALSPASAGCTLNWLHPQTKPSIPRGPGCPLIVPSPPPANGPKGTHLMSEALRRGIQEQKGDWALGEEVTLSYGAPSRTLLSIAPLVK